MSEDETRYHRKRPYFEVIRSVIKASWVDGILILGWYSWLTIHLVPGTELPVKQSRKRKPWFTREILFSFCPKMRPGERKDGIKRAKDYREIQRKIDKNENGRAWNQASERTIARKHTSWSRTITEKQDKSTAMKLSFREAWNPQHLGRVVLKP